MILAKSKGGWKEHILYLVTVELRPHGIAPMNATSLFMVFWSSMLFPDSGGDAPVPSSMLFPDSGFEIAEEPLGRNSNGTLKNVHQVNYRVFF